MREPETGASPRVSEACQNVVHTRTEPRAGGDVVRPAAHRVLGHLAGSAHLLHTPIDVLQMLLQHLVPPGAAVVEQHPDLFERHPRGLAALDHGDAHDLVFAVAPAPRGVSRRPEQTHRFPVPQHVRGQFVSHVACGDLTVAQMPPGFPGRFSAGALNLRHDG